MTTVLEVYEADASTLVDTIDAGHWDRAQINTTMALGGGGEGITVQRIVPVQTVTITGSPTGGTFTLTYRGQTTGTIAYNATAATVQTALIALSNIGATDVSVSGDAGGPYSVFFAASMGPVATLTASSAGLTGGTSPGVTVARTAVENPARAILLPGRVVRVVVDGVDSGQLTIEQPSDSPASEQSEAGEVTVYKGREPMAALLDKVQWQPDRGYGILPYTPQRGLAVQADRLRDDDPAGPQGAWPFGTAQLPAWDTDNWFGRPVGFVDTAGPAGSGPHFVADRDSRVPGAPGGRWYFRQRDTIAADHDAVLVQAAFDDQGALFVNGFPVLDAEGAYKGECQQAVIPLTAGDCLVAGWCDNLNELRTGVAFAIWSIADGLADECLMRSDASKCRVLGYPDKPPGFTPTEVIRLGVDEANTRGMLPDVDTLCTFISASDTDSQPLTEVTDLTVKAPGDSLLTTCRMLSETYLDISASLAGLELNAWIRGTQGTDKTATVSFGKGNCASLRYGYDFAEQATVACIVFDDGSLQTDEVEHPDEADLGRIEVHLDFGKCSRSTARLWARKYLDVISSARRSIELTLVPGVGAVPHDDFTVGDWISVGDGGFVGLSIGGEELSIDGDPLGFSDGEPVRVAGIGLEVGPDSIPRWSVECEQPKIVLEERLSNIMRRITGPGRTILPTVSEPSFAGNGSGSETPETWSTDLVGTVVITKNGTPLADVSIATTGEVTLTDDDRKCATNDLLSFEVDGVDGFPAGWPVPAPGCWVQHVRVEATDDGRTIRLLYTTGVN